MALSLDEGGSRDDLLAVPNEVLRQPHIAPVILGAMDVFNEPAYWWTGTGDVAVLGQVFRGFGEVIGISEVSLGHVVGAQYVNFEISGDVTNGGPYADLIARIRAQKDGVIGRECRLFLGLADLSSSLGLEWICPPLTLFASNVLAEPKISVSFDGDRRMSRVSVTAEDPLTRVRKPGNGRLTEASQKSRHPGDRGLEHVSVIAKGQSLDPGWYR